MSVSLDVMKVCSRCAIRVIMYECSCNAMSGDDVPRRCLRRGVVMKSGFVSEYESICRLN